MDIQEAQGNQDDFVGVMEVENHPYSTKESFGVQKSAFADNSF